MTLSMNRQELLAAVKRAAAIAPTVSPVEMLLNVLVETDSTNGLLYLTATNMEVALKESIKLPERIPEDICFAVNAKMLTSMLSLLGGETVALTLDDSYVLSLLSEQASYRISVLPGKEFPRPELPFPEDTVKVSGIPAMVQRSVFATTENESMPLLKCLHLRFTSEGLKAVASDGSCAVSARGDKQSTGDISFLVPAVSLEKLSRLCNDKDTFTVGTTGKQLVFIKENFVFSARLMEGRYVDTDRIMGSIKNQFTVLSDAVELRNMLGSVSALASDNKVKLSFSDDVLKMECAGENGNASAGLNVIPLSGVPAGDCYFSADRLNRSLRALGGTVTLGVAQGGLLTIENEDTFYMQTPVRATTVKKAVAKKSAAKAA